MAPREPPLRRSRRRSGGVVPTPIGEDPHRADSNVPSELIYGIRYSGPVMSEALTTMRVSREALDELERFQRILNTKTADETLRALLRIKRKELLDSAYGSLSGKVSSFSEADRLDRHH